MLPVTKGAAHAASCTTFASDSGFGMLRGMSSLALPRAAVLLCVLSSGCAYGEMRQVLRSQVATESKCSDITVQKQSPYAPGYTENNYTVKGCGIDRVYTCKDDGGLVKFGSAECSYKASNAAPAGGAPSPAAAPMGDDDSDLPAGDAPSS
jgi:hypothetical protein